MKTLLVTQADLRRLVHEVGIHPLMDQVIEAVQDAFRSFDTARTELREIAGRLHPRLLDVQRLEGETVVMLFRPLMVDLLEAAGVDSREARDILPPL